MILSTYGTCQGFVSLPDFSKAPKPVQMPKPAKRPKGTQTFCYTLDESDLVCELDYHRADGDGWNEPHVPAHAELCEAFLDGVDILHDLLDCEVAEIEEAFMNQTEDY